MSAQQLSFMEAGMKKHSGKIKKGRVSEEPRTVFGSHSSVEAARGRIQAYLSQNRDVFTQWFSAEHGVVFTGALAGAKRKKLVSGKFVFLRRRGDESQVGQRSA